MGAMLEPRLSAAAVLLAAALLSPGQAAADPPGKAQVRQLLSGFEAMPAAESWRALGPETLAVLVSLYDDPSEPAYVRLRAVRAVSFYPVAATRTFLLAVTRVPGQGDLFVREAVLSLARAFGRRAVDDVRSFLSSPEPTVREAAAMGLGRIGTERARDALRRRLAIEGAEHVRRTIQRALHPPSR